MEILKKVALVVALTIFLGGTTAAGFAWWDSLEDSENNVTLPIGEGVTLSVNLDEQTDGSLIPEGAIEKTGDVTEVDVEFTVELNTTDLANELDLSVVVSNIQIGGEDTYASLVNTNVNAPSTIFNSPETVIITVTLDEPVDQTEYDAISNEDITFDVTFEASAQ